jgi:hypothetical protein
MAGFECFEVIILLLLKKHLILSVLQAVSYILATGAAAGFSATKELKKVTFGDAHLTRFFNLGYASVLLLFLAFLCTAILSILSSYALPRKV